MIKLLAPNGKPSNLTPEQWHQVRTPQFKRWFGDWEIIAKAKAIKNLRPISLDNEEHATQKEAESIIEKLENGLNKFDGRITLWVKSAIGKILRHKGFDTSLLIPKIKVVFDNSIPMSDEPEIAKEGHKAHPNFAGYHHYLGKIGKNGIEYYVRFTLQEVKTKRKDIAPNQLHSTFVSNVEIYKSTDTRVNTGNTPATANNDAYIVDTKLHQFFVLAKQAEKNCSKVVDENGEPLVVYHGTKTSGFTRFRLDEWNSSNKGFYFSNIDRASWYATGYSPQIWHPNNDESIYACFLKICNPKYKDAKGKYAINVNQEAKGKNQDGVIIDNINDPTLDSGSDFEATNYIVFSPNQIKSATDNNGDFSVNDENILHGITPDPRNYIARYVALHNCTFDGQTKRYARRTLSELRTELRNRTITATATIRTIQSELARLCNRHVTHQQIQIKGIEKYKKMMR